MRIPSRRRVVDGVLWRWGGCCQTWRPMTDPQTGRPNWYTRADGVVASKCAVCSREVAKRNREKRMAARREVLREQARNRRKYDKEHARQVRLPKVPVSVVQPWVQEYMEYEGIDREMFERRSGVASRILYRMARDPDGVVAYETADAIARATDHLVDLNRLLPPADGVDGWAPKLGYRCCEACGTWQHKHHTKGYCLRCWWPKEREIQRAKKRELHRLRQANDQRREQIAA